MAYQDTRKRKEAIRSQEKASQAEIECQRKQLAASNVEMDRKRKDIESFHIARQQELESFHVARQQEFERLLQETRELKTEFGKGFICGRKWLANAFAEFVFTRDTEAECALVVKPNPAWKAAEAVSELRSKRTDMARKLKFLEYQLASYEEYFPFLLDYRDAILDEVIDMRQGDVDAMEDIDPALSLGYLSKGEYDGLSHAEKFQLALDRYWQRNKGNVEIGRLYERYIGYLYETGGWAVSYQGIIRGYEDYGRDLICTMDGSALVVQCKCWSKHKIIREKHIMQLYGTYVLYCITEQTHSVSPVFITSTSLSKEAEMVAAELGVEVRHEELKRYPMIKCNINGSTGERIYHLPFDQQYDRVLVGNEPGEFYAETVQQAEMAGFRRAYRWRGDRADGI